jgi:hypothetical protein
LPVALAGACAGPTVRRFALADPLWEDPDRNHLTQRPEEQVLGNAADVADKTLFRPLSQLFRFPLPGEARNANALDQVANSAWFTNRIGLFAMSPEAAARGACDGPPLDATSAPWTVINAKPNGANPGFFIKTAQGTPYLLKFDSPVQPQRATAADVIGSKFYHAAGYFAPCNQIVYFEREILEIGAKATATNIYGEKEPIRQADVEKVLSMGFRLKDGRLRASASQFLPGKPLGPWLYHGVRDDDPNDVVPHEDRRELRGGRLLAAWLNHFDTRAQNTLDLWVEREGRNYVRHYYIDFGDCFGSRWESDAMSRRLGHSYYMDFRHVFVDLVTLGEIFGYYSARDFVPSRWKGGYPNPAFARMTDRDGYWMAAIISQYSEAHIRAMVRTGQLTSARAERYLVRTLVARRDAILAEYFTRVAPLDRFRLVRRTPGDPRQSLCFKDLAIEHGAVDHRQVLYKMRFHGGTALERELGWLQFQPDPDHPGRSCIVLPIGDRRPADLAGPGLRADHPLRYGVLTIYIHQRPSVPPSSSIRLHFYDRGGRQGFKLVGLERPPRPVLPDLY